jgi:hypothetical protein
MKKLILFASLVVPFGIMAQSFTITTPDSQSFKMEMEGFEIETEQSSSSSSQQTVQAEWAIVDGNTIILPDGRTLNWKYGDIDGLVGCEIEMKQPVGAQVVLSYDDKVAYSSEAPFFYREKAFQYFSSYFKLTVVEPSGKAWVVKLQNKKNSKITITAGDTSPTTTTTSVVVDEQPTEVNNDDGCVIEMGSTDFNRALESIRGKTFEDTKFDVAKQITRANCLSAEQIKMVMRAFEFEDTRLEYAIFAYKYCVDQNQYYIVNEAFEFELTIEELQEYLDDQY